MISDILLIVDGIKGEAQDEDYPDCIELDSWQWGVSQNGVTPKTSSSGEYRQSQQSQQLKHIVSATNIVVTKRTDEGSLKLVSALIKNRLIKEVKIVNRKRTGNAADASFDFLMMTMYDVRIMNHSIGSDRSHVLPMESYEFNFCKIKYEYARQLQSGGKSATVTVEYTVPAAEMRY